MTGKLLKQIRNEWNSNLWILIELILVIVVMWFLIDRMYIKYIIYNEPLGFDISHCYRLEMGSLTSKSPDYIENNSSANADIIELGNRIRLRDDIEAVGFANNSHPYNGSNSGTVVGIDSLRSYGYCVRRVVSPDFIKVFRYQGTRGETPQQLAEIIDAKAMLISDNTFYPNFNVKATSYVGKEISEFNWKGESADKCTLGASLVPIRYQDFNQGYYESSILIKMDERDYRLSSELCIRVLPDKDVDFANRLRADIDKHYRLGNIFISNITSFKDLRRSFLLNDMNVIKTSITGAGFLLMNIFIGLLGTFWFRTQKRRSEIALLKTLGATNSDIIVRQIAEGFILLGLAIIPALIISYNIASAGLTEWYNNANILPQRFFITMSMTVIPIAFMMIAGIVIPVRKSSKIDPAVALREE